MIGSSKSIWGFDPRSVPGCSLWLDGADTSQVTFSSSTNVNTWIDKSGFNNNCSNQSLGSTITYPGTKVNGLNTVNFTAGCIRGAFNGSSVINTTDVTIFIVTVETAPNNNLRMFSLTTAANYQDDTANTMLVYCAPGNYQLTFYRAGAMPTPYTVTQNVPFIYSLTQTSGTGSMWLNGGSNTTASITTSAFAVTNYNIGTQYLANQNYTGLMCEILVYKSLLTTSQRQQVEGYLAWKWGLTTYLPAISPLSIPGCQLWLDAADASTLVLSGSNVTQWNDKSGNGFNGTAVNASVGSPIAPSYVTNSINGLSAITMSGTSYFTGSTNVNSTTLTCFFIGNCVFGTGGSSQQRILGLSVTGLDDYSSTLRPIPLAVISGGTQLLSYRNANMASATVVSGTNFIGCCLFDGTSNYMYKDGTLGTQVASSGTFTTSIYGVGSDAGTQFMGFTSSLGTNCLVGKIGEILVYNTALTTAQRQSIEVYLARKWGFTSMYSALPSIHPFSSIRPHLRTFQPADIPGCQLWLDAADSSTLVLSGSNVTQMKDKSSNSYTFTGSVGTYPTRTITLNGLPVISKVFGQFLQATDFNQNFTTATFFAVVRPTEDITPNGKSANGYPSYDIIQGTQSGDLSFIIIYPNESQTGNTSKFTLEIAKRGTNLFSGALGGASPSTYNPVNTPLLVEAVLTGSSATNASYLNGTSVNLTYNDSTTLSLVSGRTIRAFAGFGCDHAEILVFNTPLTTAQRQQIEGYLAHKWGLTTPIPSTHPFKSILPATAAHFSPTSITGCQLWLDGADPAAITLGTGVGQWTDKSGNAYNLTQSTTGSQPTYASSLVTFANDKYLNIPPSVMNNLPTWSLFFVFNPISSSNWIITKHKFGVDSYNILSMTYNTTSGGGLQSGTVSTLYWRSMNAGTQFVSPQQLTTSTLQFYSLTYDGTNLYFYKNGEFNQTTTGTFAIQNQTSPDHYTLGAFIYPGGQLTNPGVTNFKLGEMIVYNTFLTNSQREQIEGYFAHKWGLTSSLYSTHPYKSLPPIFPPTVQYTLTATGGTIVSSGSLKYHVFRSSSSFVVSTSLTVNYLIVGGGGGGGDRHGGGGGAGGVLSGTWSASAGTYTVTVGAGGQYGATSEGGQTAYGFPNGCGSKGGDSVISGTAISITAYGGGGGGSYDGNPTGTVGSGGGGGGQNLSGIAGTAGQGNAGGGGLLPGAGGGGGAGGAGVAANTGTGGIGTSSFSSHLLAVGYGTTFAVATSPNTVISGGVAYIAGGGGGCAGTSPGPGGSGGLGGGGRGDWADTNITAGTPNTGGGGGGTRSHPDSLQTTGRNGGSGLVLLWY